MEPKLARRRKKTHFKRLQLTYDDIPYEILSRIAQSHLSFFIHEGSGLNIEVHHTYSNGNELFVNPHYEIKVNMNNVYYTPHKLTTLMFKETPDKGSLPALQLKVICATPLRHKTLRGDENAQLSSQTNK
ncbi:CLUMA_CG011241, isoform A [Clunio marinus]|uniref:CLUMA_CG011241, isoform A n=1 Tax=Clunio marinus TaxID=568069 RepID=A0A1J1IDN0_9DIPT|nr:CLUMA_CG011241, isoform A [Clunio marinus]